MTLHKEINGTNNNDKRIESTFKVGQIVISLKTLKKQSRGNKLISQCDS